uniref:Uncharacterized protein n=1 Tax=Pseudomonas phage RVTF4 TaxID=3236931 RepID=A0AB39CD79_9VIRU
MSLSSVDIQKNAATLRDYHSPKLIPVMGWSVVIHHDTVRLYDPLGTFAAEVAESKAAEYFKCQPEHLDMFLTEAVKITTA